MRRYRLYIDESGTHGYNDMGDVGGRFLAITGLMIESELYRTQFHPHLQQLKQDTIPHDPDKPIILHRKEIVGRSGVFKVLQDPIIRRQFDEAILEFMAQQEYRIITVVLDKKEHQQKYGGAAFHPYHYCLGVLLERYCGLLNHQGSKGDVLAESRGKREDGELKKAYSNLLLNGTSWRGAAFFAGVLTETELKTAKKESNISGLQFADLVAYPSKEDVLSEYGRIQPRTGEFRDSLRRAMRRHYNRQLYDGRIRGYGMVLL